MLTITNKKALSMIKIPENEHLEIEGEYYFHQKGMLQKLKTDLEVINPFHKVIFEFDGEPTSIDDFLK